MSTLMIVTRHAKDGPRYAVRYRLGGRAYPIQHAGSFRTLREAKSRRDLVAGELAAGRNPADKLREMLAQPEIKIVITIDEWGEKFLASRIDIDANTKRNYRTALKKVGETFGDRDPSSITVDDVTGWIAKLVEEGRKPGTIQLYLLTFRLLLDYAGCDPNPARDPRVKLPKRVRESRPRRRPNRSRPSSPRSGRSGSSCSSRSSRAASASGKPSGCVGGTSTWPAFACVCHGALRSVTPRAGSTCPSG
jgi:integrase family protein with SAM-like domain